MEGLSDAHREIILLRKFQELLVPRDRRPPGQVRGRLPHAARARAQRTDPAPCRTNDVVTVTAELQSLIERYIEEHVLHGRTLDAAALCDGRAELIEPLRVLIAEYTALTRDLDWNPTVEGPTRRAGGGPAGLRGVSHHRAHRRRRHGRGVQAPRPAPRPHRRRQGSSPGRRAARRRGRIPRRSALPRALLRSPHRAAARVPAGDESSRADHGARRRVRAGPHRAVARIPPARPRAARGVPRDRPRARTGHPAPRPQAVEHHGRRAAGPAHPRLRLERRRSEGGSSQGHAAIRRARTARAVAADRRADRRLRPRRDPLRAVVRPPAVHRQQRRHPRRHPARPAAPADRALAGCSGRSAGDRAQGDGARSAAPLSIGAGDGR